MSKYLRVNLVFNKNVLREVKAYETLIKQRNKSDYIVNAIHFFQDNRIELNKQELRALIEEVLGEQIYDYFAAMTPPTCS